MLRILAGEFRSRQLLAPPDAETTRPYTSRVRETVFNHLRGWIEGAQVLDLFAGVGTMGLEAASRGAESVLMVEQNRRIFSILQQNIVTLGCDDRVRAMYADALGQACLDAAGPQQTIVFMDPPYSMMTEARYRARVLAQVHRCAGYLDRHGFLILRSPLRALDEDMSVQSMEGPEVHRFGRDMAVLFYSPS